MDRSRRRQELLRKTVAVLGLVEDGACLTLAGRFVPHATSLASWPPTNVALPFATEAELLSAISASCCVWPVGVRHRGAAYFDGGFSDSLPSDEALPTVHVSILSGPGVQIAPGAASRDLESSDSPRDHHHLRYELSRANAIGALEAGLMRAASARHRFKQGHTDALKFLAATGHTESKLRQP